MNRLIGLLIIGMCFLLSACTIAQYTYMRNLTDQTVEIYFDFNPAATIPDSVYIPMAQTSHPIGKNTYTFMVDSVVAKRYTNTTLIMRVPPGAMIMFDKNSSHKIGYAAPEKIKVKMPGKEAYTVKLVPPYQEGERVFKTKGNSPKLYWYDIY